MIVDLRVERLKRANRRLQQFDNAGAAVDLQAARYMLCVQKLPGASLREIAIMTRQQKTGRGAGQEGSDERRTSRKPRSRNQR
jgi:hypothetical protein